MVSVPGGHFSKGTKYGSEEIRIYSQHVYGLVGEAFLHSAITEDLKKSVPGKRVLDIGCGAGNWCVTAAQYGAKSVDGFDIQPEMVELAKQATSHLDMVHIQVGDAADMPYGDDSFDVAISLFVACNLSPEGFTKHFQELDRVLAPGGKAIILAPTDWSRYGLYIKIEADPSVIRSNIAHTLSMMPKYPSTAQVTETFKSYTDILTTFFAVNDDGYLFHIEDISRLSHGQPVWHKCDMMTFPNYFYSEKSLIEQFHTNGFHVDKIDNNFTEDKRAFYNSTNPPILVSEDYVTHPTSYVYHVTKY
ncbi:uncharacterized protein [Dysidea avara]|uniref:uncharacterized protein n=1 Tax=Dysidea avara TaxID=196820 RepID=UPI00332FD21B